MIPTSTAQTASPTPTGPTTSSRWTTGRVVAVTAAAVSLLVGSVLLLGGAGLAVTAAALRGDDGLVTTSPSPWTSPGHAVRSEAVRLEPGPMMPDMPRRMMGTLHVTASGQDGRDIFIGIARTRDVGRYLDHVSQSTMHDPWDEDGGSTFTPGGAPTSPPGSAGIWIASAHGSGTRSLQWEPRSGDWTLVVMNEDGRAPVAADVRMSAELPFLDTLSVALILGGAVLIVVAATGLILAIPRSSHSSADA